MHDARDAEDTRLLAAGDHAQLLGNYFHPVRERCRIRLRDRDDGDEATQLVFLRLAAELRRGRTYAVPFRVVVWNVVTWTLNGFTRGARQETPLPETWDPAESGGFEDWEERYDLERLFDALPDGQREVARLRYLDGLEPAEIAERLGIEANAVYQRLFNAHRKLEPALSA